MNTPWAFIGKRWHRVKIMRIAKPYLTTHCGLDRNHVPEFYWDPRGQLPIGLTCRRCY